VTGAPWLDGADGPDRAVTLRSRGRLTREGQRCCSIDFAFIKNWSAFFREIPDLQAELLASAVGEDTEWGEWHWHGTWHGTCASGGRFEMRGVTFMGTRNDHIVWGRLYMEEVEEVGEDIDQAVQRLAAAGGDCGQAN